MTSKSKKETSVVVLQRQVKELNNLLIGYRSLLDFIEGRLQDDGLARDALDLRLKRIESDLRQIWDIVDPD